MRMVDQDIEQWMSEAGLQRIGDLNGIPSPRHAPDPMLTWGQQALEVPSPEPQSSLVPFNMN